MMSAVWFRGLIHTSFFVDHEKTLRALALVQHSWMWLLGSLSDSKEFLLVIRVSSIENPVLISWYTSLGRWTRHVGT